MIANCYQHSFTPSLIHTSPVLVGLEAHCVFECAFCQLMYNPQDVCQRNDRCEIVLCCTNNQIYTIPQRGCPLKVIRLSAFLGTHPTRQDQDQLSQTYSPKCTIWHTTFSKFSGVIRPQLRREVQAVTANQASPAHYPSCGGAAVVIIPNC